MTLAFISFYLFGCTKNTSVLTEQELKLSSNTLASASTAGICDYDLIESSLTSTGWTKVFDEDFSGNFNKWNIWTGGAYNNELQLYRAANLSISGGMLSIQAKKETVTGPTLPSNSTPKSFDFTSGRIESKTNFSAKATTPKVRMMTRIKLPTGYGMWPAFWSYGDPWPTQGEIDIVEARGNEPYNYSTAYWYGRRAGVNLASNTESHITSAYSLTECFHVYEVIWEKNMLSFYLDGQLVDVKTGGYIPSFFRKQQRITLNLAVGGAFFGNPSPSEIVTGTMQVDWVKVFTSK